MREVMCSKLNKRAPGLSYPPFIKGALAARIYHHISEEAWKMWLSHCVMVINENRLNPSDIKAQARLNKELEDFLFGDGGNRPAGYTPPS
jgi:Fe-S cluster biosynthesis and repair protein YggX